MAVAFDAVGPSSAGTNSVGSPLTWTHTASGSNRAVIVGISQNNNVYVAGEVTVTYGGTAMTFLGERPTDDQPSGAAQLFGLVNPPTGAQTVSAQHSTGTYGFIGGSISFTGVDQTTPFGTAVTAAGDNSGGSTPPTASVSSASGNMVVDVVVYGSALSGATGTLQWMDNVDSSTGANNAAQSTYAGASSVTVGYNPTNKDWWGLVAVSINAASGGGGGGSANAIAWIRA
jgi:hypothetical protein